MLDNDGDGTFAIGIFATILVIVSAFHVYLWWLVFTELRMMSYRQVQILNVWLVRVHSNFNIY